MRAPADLAVYFPGAPRRPFHLPLSRVPGYRPPDDEKVLQESANLVSYMLDSGPKDKRIGLNGVLVSLSGGMDSSTTALVSRHAVESYGRGKKLVCVTISTDPRNEMEMEDVESARRLCKDFDIEHVYVDASPVLSAWEHVQPSPQGNPAAHFNRVARLRANIARQEAIARRMLVASTFTRSEFLLRAYSDGLPSPNFSFLGALYKTEVFDLGKHVGVPDYVQKKNPGGSELQHDDTTLYGADFRTGLDAAVFLLHESKKSPDQISRTFGIDKKWLERLHEHMTRQDWRVGTTSLGREDVLIAL